MKAEYKLMARKTETAAALIVFAGPMVEFGPRHDAAIPCLDHLKRTF
jgi:hypothetical protein